MAGTLTEEPPDHDPWAYLSGTRIISVPDASGLGLIPRKVPLPMPPPPRPPTRASTMSQTEMSQGQIHASGYPHLVSAILSSADKNTCLAFRGTSTELAAQAAQHLASHLHVRRVGSSYVVSSPHGRVPALEPGEYWDWDTQNWEHTVGDSVRLARFRRQAVMFGAVRVLDLEGDVSRVITRIARALIHVKAIRLIPDDGGWYVPHLRNLHTAHTLVVFAKPDWRQKLRMWRDDIVLRPMVPVPGNMRKVVMWLRWHANQSVHALVDLDLSCAHEGLKEVVLAFAEWPAEDAEGSRWQYSWDDSEGESDLEHANGHHGNGHGHGHGHAHAHAAVLPAPNSVARRRREWLCSRIAQISQCEDSIRITLVNAHHLRPEWLGYDPFLSPEGLVAQLEADIAFQVRELMAYWPPKDEEGEARRAMARVSFVSGQEYSASLSPEQRELELVPWSCCEPCEVPWGECGGCVGSQASYQD